MSGADQGRSSIMWTILRLIYREYCKARLMEMRKYHRAAPG
jgi:hypothetical protein